MGVDTTPQALVRVYEAEKDQWQPLTSMPTPRYGATPFIRGNKIYMMGRKLEPVTLFLSFHFSMRNTVFLCQLFPDSLIARFPFSFPTVHDRATDKRHELTSVLGGMLWVPSQSLRKKAIQSPIKRQKIERP